MVQLAVPENRPGGAVSDSVGVSAYNANLMSSLAIMASLAFMPQSVLTLGRNTELRFGQQPQALETILEAFVPIR